MAAKRRHYGQNTIADREGIVRTVRESLIVAAEQGREFGRIENWLAPFSPIAERHEELVPSAVGKILELCVAIPNTILRAGDAVLDVYRKLIQSFDQAVRVHVVCDPDTLSEVQNLFESWAPRCSLGFVPYTDDDPPLRFGRFEKKFTNWVQDPFVSVQRLDLRDAAVLLVEPFGFFDAMRLTDGPVADSIAASRPRTDSRVAEAIFMGGNVLSLDDHVLVGADELYYHERLFPRSVSLEPAERERVIRSALQHALTTPRPIRFVRSLAVLPRAGIRQATIGGEEWTEETVGALNEHSVQPIFHIDMFITATGVKDNAREVLLVGDPALAARHLQRVPTQEMMITAFDEIAESLANDFTIIRSPLPLVFMDDPARRHRHWYFATYNNVLIESEEGRRSVWMPSYGYGDWDELAVTDELNRDIWWSLGFSVHDIGDCHALAERRGVVHCITNTLRRQMEGRA